MVFHGFPDQISSTWPCLATICDVKEKHSNYPRCISAKIQGFELPMKFWSKMVRWIRGKSVRNPENACELEINNLGLGCFEDIQITSTISIHFHPFPSISMIHLNREKGPSPTCVLTTQVFRACVSAQEAQWAQEMQQLELRSARGVRKPCGLAFWHVKFDSKLCRAPKIP